MTNKEMRTAKRQVKFLKKNVKHLRREQRIMRRVNKKGQKWAAQWDRLNNQGQQ